MRPITPRVALSGAGMAVVAATALMLPRGGSVATAAQTPSDSAFATEVLAAVRGASPLACEMLIRTVGQGWWSAYGRHPDARAELREHLRWMSSHTSDPSSVVPLRRGLEDPDPCARRVAARLLGRHRHPSAGAALLQGLQSVDAETRRLAAIGLGYAELRDATDPLIATLRDGEASVRSAAAWALGEIEDPRATAPLVALLERDPDPSVRRAAAWALGAMQ